MILERLQEENRLVKVPLEADLLLLVDDLMTQGDL